MHKLATKLVFDAEQSRTRQIVQRPQFAEIVLNRRTSDDHAQIGRKLTHALRELRRRALELVSLVHDDPIPAKRAREIRRRTSSSFARRRLFSLVFVRRHPERVRA